MAKYIGLSFRRGPFGWEEEEISLIESFRFGLWDIPAWMILDHVLVPGYGANCVVSDIYSHAVLNNVAIDGTEKMRQDLMIDFENTLKTLDHYGLKTITLDFGLTDVPENEDNDILELRFNLLRMMWRICYKYQIKLLMPVKLPLETPEQDQWINYVLQRAMCADLGLVGDIQVHRIKKIPNINDILGANVYDYKLIRLCWNAEDGNVIAPAWFAPWDEWVKYNPLNIPIAFEPTHHHNMGFIQHARNVAELSGMILPQEPHKTISIN